jgi:hypothetical protein
MQTTYYWDSDDLIKSAIVASKMPVPYPFRCKYESGCQYPYFEKKWLIPYSQRMKGYPWNTTYRREENCGQNLWFFVVLFFVIAIIK